MFFCSLPDNLGDKKYCTPWKQKVLTCDFQNYSSLGKEKTLNEIENAFSVWQNVCNLKFETVFDGSQVMNIAFLTDDEKQNAEINCPYKLNNKKSGTLAHGFYPGNSTLSGDLHFDNERFRLTAKECGLNVALWQWNTLTSDVPHATEATEAWNASRLFTEQEIRSPSQVLTTRE